MVIEKKPLLMIVPSSDQPCATDSEPPRGTETVTSSATDNSPETSPTLLNSENSPAEMLRNASNKSPRKSR